MSGDDRRTIGLIPSAGYPADGLRTVEALALRVLERLPSGKVARTRDAIQIDDGEEGVCLMITAEHLELRLPSIEWTCGAYGPARTSVLWKRAKWASLSDERLDELLMAARRARHAPVSGVSVLRRTFSTGASTRECLPWVRRETPRRRSLRGG